MLKYFFSKKHLPYAAHFEIGGYTNKQNYRTWGQGNKQIIHEKPLHTQLVTV